MRRIWLIGLLVSLSAAGAVGQGTPLEEAAEETPEPSPSEEPTAPVPSDVPPEPVRVSGWEELAAALKTARPGSEILVAPGVYRRGVAGAGLHGTEKAPIVIRAEREDQPPLFKGMAEAIKLSQCSYVKVKNLEFRDCSGNGVNIDDGGEEANPSAYIVLEGLRFDDIGPRGNHDAIKLSGVRGFLIRGCRFQNWGGSAIDMVGCHWGVVEGCLFEGRQGARQKNSIQIKGGSSFVLVQSCAFLHAGERVVNIGGQTGEAYFRPPDARSEATEVTIAGCRFVGGESHIACVTSDRAHIHHNLFYQPGKWLVRILQESDRPEMHRCRNGLLERNVIVTSGTVHDLVNVGRRTQAGTFLMRRNVLAAAANAPAPSCAIRREEGIDDAELAIEAPLSAESRLVTDDPRLEDIGPWAYEPLIVREFAAPALRPIPKIEAENVLARWVMIGALLAAGALAAWGAFVVYRRVRPVRKIW